MAVQLILLEDVADLGKIGDQVHVSDGYARNYLLPRNLAAKVTPGILKKIEKRKLQLQKEAEERIGAQMPVAEKAEKSHYVIANDGSCEDLRKAVSEFARWLAKQQ